jgi:hypothetical protein
VTRWLLGCLGFLALAQAPLQCGTETDPSLRRRETPEEALYALARRFNAEGDRHAWRETLQFLIQRYPNSRFAVRAKDDLARAPADAPTSTEQTSDED